MKVLPTRHVVILLFCLFLVMPLQAQNQLSLGELQAGQLALNLSLTEQKNVEQDTLNISLHYVTQGRDRKALQEEVNKAMQDAIKLLESVSQVEFSTSYYQVQIVDAGRPTRTDISNPVFRAQQGVHATSTDSSILLELTGKLQASGLVLDGLYYTLSEEVHEKVAGELLNSALQKLQSRAQDAARTLGKQQAELVEVTMDGTPNFLGMRQRVSMDAFSSASAEFAPPVADPGETSISVTVSARAVLSP